MVETLIEKCKNELIIIRYSIYGMEVEHIIINEEHEYNIIYFGKHKNVINDYWY